MSSAAAAAPQDLQQFTDALQVALDSYDLLVERLAVLEDQLREPGWQRIGGNTREFTREGLRNISRMVRIYWLKNPLIKRAVAVQNLYVWGQGVTLRAVHPTVDAVVQKVLKDPTNRTVFGDVEAWMRLETGLQLFATSSSSSSSTRAPATSRSVRSRSTRLRRSSQTPMTPRTPGITSAPGL